ncbi:hypothetical protein B9G53_26325 [Pseudanabaena sp. SR411]|uniref:hypothetical protein n=1 Tax=Pseudanabaena sp. SR411 TaxID=1980935 RepID=UPI000B98ECC4|nr:hypothetical protein [Pseudanabaena sp. SR411]OYQ61645.1 hypothetical protein B9G53_26325 [Pseudanabaena sp. SR411]
MSEYPEISVGNSTEKKSGNHINSVLLTLEISEGDTNQRKFSLSNRSAHHLNKLKVLYSLPATCFLDSVILYCEANPEFEKMLIAEARELQESRQREATCKRARTMSKNFLS